MRVCVCVYVCVCGYGCARACACVYEGGQKMEGGLKERMREKISSVGGEREIESAELGGCGRILCGTVGQQECPHLGNVEEPHCNGG